MAPRKRATAAAPARGAGLWQQVAVRRETIRARDGTKRPVVAKKKSLAASKSATAFKLPEVDLTPTGLAAQLALRLEERGLVNATALLTVEPTPAAPAGLPALADRAKQGLSDLRPRLPTVPGSLLRLGVLVALVSVAGSQVLSDRLPTYDEIAAQAQVSSAKRGASDMGTVEQLVEREERAIKRAFAEIEEGRKVDSSEVAAATAASKQLRAAGESYRDALGAVREWRSESARAAAALEGDITAALERAEKGYDEALATPEKLAAGAKAKEVMADFESAEEALVRSRSMLARQVALRKASASGARAAALLEAAAASNEAAAGGIEEECRVLEEAAGRLSAVAERSIVDGKVAPSTLPEFQEARAAANQADEALAERLSASAGALEAANKAASAANAAADEAARFVKSGGAEWYTDSSQLLQRAREAAVKAQEASSRADGAANKASELGAAPDRWKKAKAALAEAEETQQRAQTRLARARDRKSVV